MTKEDLIQKWYAHGMSVSEKYNQLIKDPQIIGDEKIIEWFRQYQPLEGIAAYHVHHDIGKPYCIEYDEQGKAHYPNHAEVSYRIYCERFGHSIYADLIRHDMTFHTARGDDLIEAWKLPFADHLYATAWAELFANAELFGGTDSDSFKIKRKRLIQAFKKK